MDLTNEVVLKVVSAVETAAPKVWTILLRQTLVEGYAGTGFGLLLMIVSIFWARACAREVRKDTYGPFDVSIGIVAGMLFIAGILFFGSNVLKIVNPEYYAIDALLNLNK